MDRHLSHRLTGEMKKMDDQVSFILYREYWECQIGVWVDKFCSINIKDVVVGISKRLKGLSRVKIIYEKKRHRLYAEVVLMS